MNTDQKNNFATLRAHDIEQISERKESSPLAFAVWIRQLLQNWRQGTVYAQGRSQVSKSGKKPWKQKGTGRARAGDARSPLWRGGGVIHGPQKRSRTLKCCKKQKNNVLNALLWNYIDNGAIHIIPGTINENTPKTSLAKVLLKPIESKKITLFLSAHDYINYASFVNLANVTIIYFDSVNAFDLSSAQCWAVLEKDISTFKDMVSQWN